MTTQLTFQSGFDAAAILMFLLLIFIQSNSDPLNVVLKAFNGVFLMWGLILLFKPITTDMAFIIPCAFYTFILAILWKNYGVNAVVKICLFALAALGVMAIINT